MPVEEVVSTLATRLAKDSKEEEFAQFEQHAVRVVEEVALLVYPTLSVDEQEGITRAGLIELAVGSAQLKHPAFSKNMAALFSQEQLANFSVRIEEKTRAAEDAQAEAPEDDDEEGDEEEEEDGGMGKYLLTSWTHW